MLPILYISLNKNPFIRLQFEFCKTRSLPNDNFFKWTKLKALADDKLNVAKIMISVFSWVENIEGKGENAGYKHFLLFTTMFSKGFFLRVINPFPHNDTF